MKTKLIVMSFDGDYQTERPEFETVEQAWEHSNDLGSRWFFYPFHFVTTASGKTVKAAPDGLSQFEGMRLSKVASIFAETAKLPEMKNAGVDEFALALPIA